MTCLFCNEEILPGEMRRAINEGEYLHIECIVRMFSGSAEHIQKRCTCYGGRCGDSEDGLTIRESAKRAYEAWRADLACQFGDDATSQDQSKWVN